MKAPQFNFTHSLSGKRVVLTTMSDFGLKCIIEGVFDEKYYLLVTPKRTKDGGMIKQFHSRDEFIIEIGDY